MIKRNDAAKIAAYLAAHSATVCPPATEEVQMEADRHYGNALAAIAQGRVEISSRMAEQIEMHSAWIEEEAEAEQEEDRRARF